MTDTAEQLNAGRYELSHLRSLEAASRLGDSAKLDELLTVVEQLPVGFRPPLLDAAAHRYRARMAGDDPSADASFTRAAAQLRALELPFHLAVVLLPEESSRDDVRATLAEAGIQTSVHYPPIHRFSRYEELGARRPLPLTDAVAPRLLTLPLYGRMRDEDVQTVASALLAAV